MKMCIAYLATESAQSEWIGWGKYILKLLNLKNQQNLYRKNVEQLIIFLYHTPDLMCRCGFQMPASRYQANVRRAPS